MVVMQGRDHTSGAYRSYLVRFWQSNEQGRWRASAQCVQTGNTVLFGSVERLLAFLSMEIDARLGTEGVGPKEGSPGAPSVPTRR